MGGGHAGAPSTPALPLLLSAGLPSTYNPVPSGAWLRQFPGEVRGGGDVSSRGAGQAWLPLWKSPTLPSPAQLGRGPIPPPLRNRHTFVLFHPLHAPLLVSRCPG